MKNQKIIKNIVLGTIIMMIIPVVSSLNTVENPEISNLVDYENISADEAWDFLSDLSNGIQIPIDVRYESEWYFKHIDTPLPEHPRFWCLCILSDPMKLEQFISKYDGLDIIFYCKTGGRSATASQIVYDAGFTGQIYNMLGGIDSWVNKGYPVTQNDFLEINVDQAWELLNNTNNAYQKPIDVRTLEEYIEDHIDTPYPENASHYPLTDLYDPEKLDDFLDNHEGIEIVFYSNEGVRSLEAAEILADNSFEGTIYNLLGGMDAWKTAGYPTSSYIPEPTLCCIGELNWTNIQPGEELTGQIEVCNCGEKDSLLNWKCESGPNWGTWIIQPSNGTNLPNDECVTINITCIAPDDTGTEFNGTLKMVNIDDTSNFCEIDIYLSTPRDKLLHNTLFLRLLERFPNAFLILKYLLGLKI